MGQIWLERLLRWQAKLQKLLIGRYARMDQLNRFLLRVCLILLIVNLFLPTTSAFWLAAALLIWMNFRFFSKKIYPRLNENTRFLTKQKQLSNYFQRKKAQFEAHKTYKYFNCPSCKQQLRAPKGRGKIKVTCSSCKHQFYKNV
jgi:predicted membrane protein